MVPTSIKLIAFDWDGTLLDSKEATLEAYKVVFSEAGIPLKVEEMPKYYSPNWHLTYKALGLPENLYDWADNRWHEIYQKQKRSLMEGAFEILCWLKRQNYLTVLLTAATRKRVEEELKSFHISCYFNKVVCMEDFGVKKPDPLPLIELIKEVNIKPLNLIYVGDSPEDIEMGKMAGVWTAGITGPYIPEETLRASNPSFFLKDLFELKALLSK